jgi:predicted sulfurtransferase
MVKRHLCIAIAITLFSISAGCLQLAPPDTTTPRITKEELKSKLDNPDVIIIDVRLADEWKRANWKIKGAIREDPEKFKSWADKFPKEKTLVFY